MIDVSESIDSVYKHAAVALGIRVAEKSKLGKRILTFSGKPKWNNLESCNDFVSMVDNVYQDIHGMNKNFYEALNFILDAIIDSKLSQNNNKKFIENNENESGNEMYDDENRTIEHNIESKIHQHQQNIK